MKSQELFPTPVISFVHNHVMWAFFSLSPSCSPVSCFFCLFCHLAALSFLCLSLPPSAFVSPLWFLFVGESSSCQIKASPPCFVLLHLHALMSLEQHTQPTNLQTCRLASYMIGWCAVLLLLGAPVFWRRGRGSQSRERFGSFMGLNLPLYGVEGSLR